MCSQGQLSEAVGPNIVIGRRPLHRSASRCPGCRGSTQATVGRGLGDSRDAAHQSLMSLTRSVTASEQP